MLERIGLTKRWSDAVVVGDLIFLSGHVADRTAGQSITDQTEEVLTAIDETLSRAGVSKSALASVQIYLSDIKQIDEMNVVWDRWVAEGAAPARATVEARLASPDFAIEITAIASR